MANVTAPYRHVTFDDKRYISRKTALETLESFLTTHSSSSTSMNLFQNLPGLRVMLSEIQDQREESFDPLYANSPIWGMNVAYDSLFEEFKGRIEVHINPCLLGDPNKAFNLLLGDVLLEYWQELEGTLLCFSHAKPVSNIATIYGAYVHCVFSFRGLSLRPKEKTTGVGRVTRTTDATHIVIQVLGFFNVLMQAKYLTKKGFSYKDEWRGPANETILNELLQFRYHGGETGFHNSTSSHPVIVRMQENVPNQRVKEELCVKKESIVREELCVKEKESMKEEPPVKRKLKREQVEIPVEKSQKRKRRKVKIQ